MTCSGLVAMAYLASGNAKLSRRAKAMSERTFVVIESSRTRKRYERQGVLVGEAALEQAETECIEPDELEFRRRIRAALAKETETPAEPDPWPAPVP
ncbi:MAG TPA: hypothetical protein VG815_17705 [Chloroflexota bacterium]|nr:hypothetical protein [Chloroflexota bacterium]